MTIAIVIIAILIAIIGVIFFLRFTESRYLNKSVTEAMSDEMWDVIAKEREESLEKGRKFRTMLDDEMSRRQDTRNK